MTSRLELTFWTQAPCQVAALPTLSSGRVKKKGRCSTGGLGINLDAAVGGICTDHAVLCTKIN